MIGQKEAYPNLLRGRELEPLILKSMQDKNGRLQQALEAIREATLRRTGAMMCEFHTVSKRGNSTLTPASSGNEKEVYIKENSGLLNPVLEIQTTEDPTSWNYLYIPDYGRYYFLDDWIYYRGIWSVQGECDVLASWKDSILNTSAMVQFSSIDYNLMAMDGRIASTAAYDRQVESAPFAGSLTGQQTVPGGYFALTVIAANSTWATGGATTYFLSYQDMQSFAAELATDNVWTQMEQFFKNPEAGIIDCYYLPIDVSAYVSLSTAQPVTIGDYTFGAAGRLALSTNLAVKSKSASITIPWRYDDFRRLSPYTEISLFVPFCGAKTLPSEMLADVEAVLVDYSVDVSTGAVQAICHVKQEVIAEFSGNLRVALPIGQTQARVDSILGASGSAVTAIGGAITGNPIAVGAGAVAAVSSIVSPTSHNVCGGFQGSVLGAILGNDVSRWQQFRLAATSRDTTEEPENLTAVIGSPLYKVRAISGLTGYCQTSGFSVNAACTQTERERINRLMDGGVYIE